MANDTMSDRMSVVSLSAPSMISDSSYVFPDNPDTLLSQTSRAATPVSDASAANKDTGEQSNVVLPGVRSTDPVVLTSSQVNPKPETLTLAFPAFAEGEKDRYAVVAFPATYKDATEIAVQVLGRYMTDARPENVVLRCSTKNRKNEWVWADISPNDWTLVLRHNGAEVGIFEKRRKDILNTKDWFVHGKVFFTRGTRGQREAKTTWTDVKTHAPYLLIDRPNTYDDAVRTATAYLPAKTFGSDEESKDKKFTFYYFPQNDLSSWMAMPPAAYTDDDIWRAFVPQTHGILGVIID